MEKNNAPYPETIDQNVIDRYFNFPFSHFFVLKEVEIFFEEERLALSLGLLRKRFGNLNQYFNPEINDSNFIPSCPIKPGHYFISFIRVNPGQEVNGRDILFCYELLDGALPNIQGVSVLYGRDDLPENLWICGPDKSEYLFNKNGICYLAGLKYLKKAVKNNFESINRFDLTDFNGQFVADCCFPIFRTEPLSSFKFKINLRK